MVGQSLQLAGRQQFVAIVEHLAETDHKRHGSGFSCIYSCGLVWNWVGECVDYIFVHVFLSLNAHRRNYTISATTKRQAGNKQHTRTHTHKRTQSISHSNTRYCQVGHGKCARASQLPTRATTTNSAPLFVVVFVLRRLSRYAGCCFAA